MAPLQCPDCGAALAEAAEEARCAACDWSRRLEGRCWLAAESTPPAGFDAAAAQRLRALDGHFWMRERRRLVERLLERLGAEGAGAAELGCGTGQFLELLEARFGAVAAVDAHAHLLAVAETRSRKAELWQGDVRRTPWPSGRFGLVMAMDVIEHVDPDALLAEARRLAAPGGLLLVSAPASPALWSEMDARAGHRCRYTRRQMAAELRRNGWTPLGHTHYQSLLYPLVWLSSVLGTRGDAKVEREPAPWLDRLLGGVNRAEIALFSRLSLPFGSSLFIWARVA